MGEFFDFNEDQNDNHDGWFRRAFPYNYDQLAIQAVVQEWMCKIRGFPFWLHRLASLGLFSTQHLTRFLTIDTKPNYLRNIYRKLPRKLQLEFISRLVADPGFFNKLAFEQLLTLVRTLYIELSQREKKFFEELDIVVINLFFSGLVNALLMWKTAPSRTFTSTNRIPLQTIFGSLPKIFFDKSSKQTGYHWTTKSLSTII